MYERGVTKVTMNVKGLTKNAGEWASYRGKMIKKKRRGTDKNNNK